MGASSPGLRQQQPVTAGCHLPDTLLPPDQVHWEPALREPSPISTERQSEVLATAGARYVVVKGQRR